MTETILLIIACGWHVFLGQLFGWHIEQEPRLYGWCIFAYVAAVVLALIAIYMFIYSIARFIARRKSTGGGHRYKRKRRK